MSLTRRVGCEDRVYLEKAAIVQRTAIAWKEGQGLGRGSAQRTVAAWDEGGVAVE